MLEAPSVDPVIVGIIVPTTTDLSNSVAYLVPTLNLLKDSVRYAPWPWSVLTLTSLLKGLARLDTILWVVNQYVHHVLQGGLARTPMEV